MTDARQFQVLRGYHDQAGDEGSGGGGATDRGDDLPQADGAADAAAKAAEEAKKAEEAKAAEEAKKKEEDAKRAEDKSKREEGVQIPKKRFDEAVGKERAAREAAEKRAQELQEELAKKATAADVAKLEEERDALEEALDKALADNNAEEKKRLRRAIREKDSQITDARVEARAAAATAVAVEQIRYDGVVSQLEAAYPFLNPEHESYDEGEAKELVELKAAFEAAGMGSAAALRRAAKTLKPQLDAKVKKPGDEGKKAADDAEAKKKAEEEEAKRREAAVKKGQEAAAAAAPGGASGKVDNKAGDIKVGELSDDAFEKLPEAEKKRLRGD